MSKLLCAILVGAFRNEIFLWRKIDFSTFELKVDKTWIFRDIFRKSSAYGSLRAQTSLIRKQNVFEKFIFFQILFGIKRKRASAFRGETFGMFPTTLILVSRRLFCNTATLQHFWILSETHSTSDKISSAGFSRVHSTCPEKRFYNFFDLKKVILFLWTLKDIFLNLKQKCLTGLSKLHSTSPEKMFHCIHFVMEWYFKTYPCWLCAKWFEVLEKSLCGINVKVSGRVQGKVPI